MKIYRIYYLFKKFIPRFFQIAIRRKIALHKKSEYKNVWPIDYKSSKKPHGFFGWPNNKKFALY